MIPNAENYNADPDYIRTLIEQIKERHGMSQRATAKQIGISYSSLKDWMNGKAKHRYPDQFALEALAASFTD
tara:strand:- start:1159 stop:1374 length:216 start_codon:yes stop_codon:yes gene_type:complete